MENDSVHARQVRAMAMPRFLWRESLCSYDRRIPHHTVGDLLDGSDWITALTDSEVASPGQLIHCWKYHTLPGLGMPTWSMFLLILQRLLNEAFNQRSNVDESLSNWLEQMCKKLPTFKFWKMIAHYEILILIRWLTAGPELARLLSQLEDGYLHDDDPQTPANFERHEQGLAAQKTFQRQVDSLSNTIRKMGNPFLSDFPELVTLAVVTAQMRR
ncbi:Hypothetical predicted protein [Paramuricea clavata]|uniref:Uncharacterized protein n=1 Tax=Paramuricea clavata TaxID=317549 RepID=A0A7D9L8E3_PARCT|nr:Hypothetical predicted protein [Paramuricea clavata]